ncbi:MAG TPA: SusC/RagA family TonB-linked outer membrane protein, partial [Saprospiraceae bacterium]|nr:SusC/RagA family TonB-linked outer membrane protein [Saprospiraceae bacterium]
MKILSHKFTQLLLFSMLPISFLFAQAKVSGTIYEPDGLPAIGAVVMIKNTSTGTTTDYDGKYELSVQSPKDSLVISYVGFKEEILPIDGRAVIDVTLDIDAQVLTDVVVVGYGVQKKSDVTGAVSHVESKEIAKIPTSNVEQALQGKVTGVQVSAPSGQPGSSPVIRIRGVGTFGDARPIYVVDGVIMESINHLSTNDIEAIDVLKDASATAIYGSRGANGVIIVTTKKGQLDQKTTFGFSTYYGTQKVVKKIDLANGTEFATLANEAAVNENRSPLYSDVEQYGEGFDWQDYIFQTAPIFNANLSASGGGEKMTFNLSGNYFSQEGIIKQSDFNRITFRMNNEYHLTKQVKFGHNLSFINTHSVNAPGVLMNAYRVYPIFAPRDSTGHFWDTSPVGNPAAQFEFNHNFNKSNQLNGNVYAQVNFLKYFTFKSSLGLNMAYGEGKVFVPVFFVSPSSQNQENSISVNTNKNQNKVFDNLLTFSKKMGDHDLTILGGVVAQTNDSEWFGGTRKNVLGETEEFYYLDAGPADFQTNYNSADDWSIFSYLFRTQYSYQSKYLATVSYRVDGSSKFGKNNRYAQFPSFSLGWVASQEPFLVKNNIISRLKFRAGWGVTGSEKISSYPSVAIVSGGLDAIFGVNETIHYGYAPINLSNDDLKWEESKQTNIGMEISFLKNQLTAEFDYYRKVTTGILLRPNIPDLVGAANPPFQNAADILNRGIEASINWRQAGKFSYSLG